MAVATKDTERFEWDWFAYEPNGGDSAIMQNEYTTDQSLPTLQKDDELYDPTRENLQLAFGSFDQGTDPEDRNFTKSLNDSDLQREPLPYLRKKDWDWLIQDTDNSVSNRYDY